VKTWFLLLDFRGGSLNDEFCGRFKLLGWLVFFVMLKKTFDRLAKKWMNKQFYFIDSSVLVEIMFKQDFAVECKRFLNGAKSGNRGCMVSNSVLGEVFCTLLFNDVDLDRNSMIAAFEAILELVDDFAFVTIDRETIDEEKRIREVEGDWLQQMDLLNLAAGIRNNAVAFVTLDPDFSKRTGEKLGIRILNLKDSSKAWANAWLF